MDINWMGVLLSLAASKCVKDRSNHGWSHKITNLICKIAVIKYYAHPPTQEKVQEK